MNTLNKINTRKKSIDETAIKCATHYLTWGTFHKSLMPRLAFKTPIFWHLKRLCLLNGSLLEDPAKLVQAKAHIDKMMQQLDPTWNPHQKLELIKLCIKTTLSQIGQITL